MAPEDDATEKEGNVKPESAPVNVSEPRTDIDVPYDEPMTGV